MQPEQMRAARAALDWSLDRLSEASGVHRNTLSNFETRKYDGEPGKVGAAKAALEAAGVIFIEENGEAAGARLRRFRVGDQVRLRPNARSRLSYDIRTDEVGKVVGVEPHPPATGPTYRIEVQFERALVPYDFRFKYELVRAASFSLASFTESTGVQMIPNGQFIANPTLDGSPQFETDISKLPQAQNSLIIIPTADDKLRHKVEARGFFRREGNLLLDLMSRNFPDGALLAGVQLR